MLGLAWSGVSGSRFCRAPAGRPSVLRDGSTTCSSSVASGAQAHASSWWSSNRWLMSSLDYCDMSWNTCAKTPRRTTGSGRSCNRVVPGSSQRACVRPNLCASCDAATSCRRSGHRANDSSVSLGPARVGRRQKAVRSAKLVGDPQRHVSWSRRLVEGVGHRPDVVARRPIQRNLRTLSAEPRPVICSERSFDGQL